jgi:anti-anti-sigma factor
MKADATLQPHLISRGRPCRFGAALFVNFGRGIAVVRHYERNARRALRLQRNKAMAFDERAAGGGSAATSEPPGMVDGLIEPATHPSVLPVEGTLRVPVHSELIQNVKALLGRGERRILLDLARLSDIDAAGIGELVRAFNATRAAGGVLQIANASRHVSQPLEISGLLGLLTAGA